MSSPSPPISPRSLPDAHTHLSQASTARGCTARPRPVFFLDYDGTLSPIVSDPSRAFIPDATRAALTALAKRYTTAIVSGRALEKVQSLVGLDGLIYAGSHGFDIAAPDGAMVQARTVGVEWRGKLEAAARDVTEEVLPNYLGSELEDNKLAISVHYRNVLFPAGYGDAERERENDAASTSSSGSSTTTTPATGVDPCGCDESLPSLASLATQVDAIAARHGLRRTRGKCVFELRPALDWHKGKAVEYLLDALRLRSANVLPIYIGDDVTDEDAFVAMRACGGVGVLVAGADDRRVTSATCRVDSPAEVCDLLSLFADGAGYGESLPMASS